MDNKYNTNKAIYTIGYSYMPKFAKGKSIKDLEKAGLNKFGEFDGGSLDAQTELINADMSYEEAKEKIEELVKEKYQGILEIDDFWIGDGDVDADKRIYVREQEPEQAIELKEVERSGRWDDSYSRLCDELASYNRGGELWIETDKEPPVNESAFVKEAEKRNMSVEALMNKALKYRTREDFGSDGDYNSYAKSKKGKAEIKLRKQAQMVKNMGVYAKGGKIDIFQKSVDGLIWKKTIPQGDGWAYDRAKQVMDDYIKDDEFDRIEVGGKKVSPKEFNSMRDKFHNQSFAKGGKITYIVNDGDDDTEFEYLNEAKKHQKTLSNPNTYIIKRTYGKEVVQGENFKDEIYAKGGKTKEKYRVEFIYRQGNEETIDFTNYKKAKKFWEESVEGSDDEEEINLDMYIPEAKTYRTIASVSPLEEKRLMEFEDDGGYDDDYAKGGSVELETRKKFKLTPIGDIAFVWDSKSRRKGKRILVSDVDIIQNNRHKVSEVDKKRLMKEMKKKGSDLLTDGTRFYTTFGTDIGEIRHPQFEKELELDRELGEIDFAKGGNIEDYSVVEIKSLFYPKYNQIYVGSKSNPVGYDEDLYDENRDYDIPENEKVYVTEVFEDGDGNESVMVEYKKDFEKSYATGGDTNNIQVDKIVYGEFGDESLEKYMDYSNKEMMGEEPMPIQEVKDKVFDYNEDAYDFEDEINKIDDVDELADFLYENNLSERDNTYNASWWGGVRLFDILKNSGDSYDLDYPTILFMSKHRGGDVRGNYDKFEAFDIEEYGFETIPMIAHRLSYHLSDGDKRATFDVEGSEGYDLYVSMDDFGEFENDDSVTMDDVEEKFGVDLY